jgi:putative SOS response-associated peptidase YedK
MESIHDRMPVILSSADYDTWLDPEFQDKEDLLTMLRPYPAGDLMAYPVSKTVNNPRNETAACIEAVA